MIEWLCGLTMQEWRDLILTILAPLALVFGVWRTVSAHRAEQTARRRLSHDEFRAARELLGHRNTAVRLGAVITLTDFARTDVGEYHVKVMKLFAAFLVWPPRYTGGIQDGLVDFQSPDTLEVIHAINNRCCAQRDAEKKEDFSFSGRLAFSPFLYSEDTGIDWAESMVRYGFDQKVAERYAKQAIGTHDHGPPDLTAEPTSSST